jgi:ADP-ribose pyrophosphatase YjhB (NUDIX family)
MYDFREQPREVAVIKIRPSILLARENSILLMKYRYGETEVWGIPGGGVDDDETLAETLKRELDEELGLEINIESLAGLVETPEAGKVKHTLHCIFYGTVAGGEPELNPVHTTAKSFAWLDASELENCVLYPPVNGMAIKAAKGITEPEYQGLLSRTWF